MNMRTKIIFLTIVAFVITIAGCGGSENSNVGNANSGNINAAKPANNANTGLETTKKPESATTNDAPTLAPIVNAYYDALRKKDAAGAKRVMSAEFITSTETGMKGEKKTDFIAFLTEFDKIPEGKMEVRNEQINGNKATAEVKGGTYIDWTKLIFANEGGAWKITNEVPR